MADTLKTPMAIHHILKNFSQHHRLIAEFLEALLKEITVKREGYDETDVICVFHSTADWVPSEADDATANWMIVPNEFIPDSTSKDYIYITGPNYFENVINEVRKLYLTNPNLKRVDWDALYLWASGMDKAFENEEPWVKMLDWYHTRNIDRGISIWSLLFNGSPKWMCPLLVENNPLIRSLLKEYNMLIDHTPVDCSVCDGYIEVSRIAYLPPNTGPWARWYSRLSTKCISSPRWDMDIDSGGDVTIRYSQAIMGLWAIDIKLGEFAMPYSPMILQFLDEHAVKFEVTPLGIIQGYSSNIDWLSELVRPK